MKVNTIVSKLGEDKKDSFWYKGDGQIATVEHKGRIISIETRGEIRVCFEEDGDVFKNEQAVTEALERDLKDKDLNKLSEHDGWGNNNWFAFVEIDKDGNDISDDYDVAYDYDEAIEMAKGFLEELTK